MNSLVGRVRSLFEGDDVSDEVLVERVRARLGGLVRHPRAIEVSAGDGRVTLRGPILADEVDRLLRRVASVRGVRSVDNRLEVHDEPGDVPDLQGQTPARAPRSTFMQTSWSPTARLVVGAGGRDSHRRQALAATNPPAGALGHGLAALLGADPKRAMDDDLARLKSLLEEGRTRVRGEPVTREQIR